MQRRNLAVLLVVVVVAVVGFVIASGSDDKKEKKSTPAGATAPTPTTGTTPKNPNAPQPGEPANPAVEVMVKGGKPVGGIQHLEFDKGDRVRFVVKSDVADEVHVHGYDLMKDVKAGGEAAFDFKADIDGKFEIELENSKQQIADLAVNP